MRQCIITALFIIPSPNHHPLFRSSLIPTPPLSLSFTSPSLKSSSNFAIHWRETTTICGFTMTQPTLDLPVRSMQSVRNKALGSLDSLAGCYPSLLFIPIHDADNYTVWCKYLWLQITSYPNSQKQSRPHPWGGSRNQVVENPIARHREDTANTVCRNPGTRL